MITMRMKTAWLYLFFATILLLNNGAGNAAETKEEHSSLWPGESYTFHGVTVKWEIAPESETTTGPIGRLRFSARKGSLVLDTPVERELARKIVSRIQRPDGTFDEKTESTQSLRGRTLCVYFADAKFIIHGVTAGPAASIQIEAETQPSTQEFSALPQRRGLFLSTACPLTLNDWTLAVSENRVKYLDGSELLEIRARRAGDDSLMKLPAVKGATRRFGRFEIFVDRVFDDTQTVVLSVKALPDRSVPGADAYVELLECPPNLSWEEFINPLAEEYGFEVEWVESPPGVSESIEYAKNTQFGNRFKVSYVRMQRALELAAKFIGPDSDPYALALEWKDPTHLQIWAKNYDKIWETKQEKARQALELEAKEAERQQQKELLAKQNADVKAKFARLTELTTKIYQLKTLSASAARNLIEPQLKVFYLYARDDTPYGMTDHIETRRSLDENAPPNVVEEVHERCVADERTNVIILSADEETHERAARLLSEWESLVERRATAGPLTQYRLEIVLLQGGKAGEPVSVEARAVRLGTTAEGRLETLSVKPGMKVKSGDTIASLDSSQLQGRIESLQIELSATEEQLQLARSSLKRAEVQFKAGLMPDSEVEATRAKLLATEADLARKKLDLEAAKRDYSELTIRAPVAGTITAVHRQAGEVVKTGDVVALLVPEVTGNENEADQSRYSTELAAEYGIGKDDFKMFGFDGVAELGRGIVALAGEKGEAGKAAVSLSEGYRCELEFLDMRQPYLIVRGRLTDAKTDRPLLENTLFLESTKPSLLGLTNLRQALILVVRRHEEK